MKLDALVRWYETLTPETVPQLGDLYHERARFRDPFNDVRGHAAIAAIFRHMFNTTEQPLFRITDRQRQGRTAWVSWVFDFGLRGRAMRIEGVSRLDFGDDGRVIEHRDYWDATELFEAFPLVGTILRHLKRLSGTPCRGMGNRTASR